MLIKNESFICASHVTAENGGLFLVDKYLFRTKAALSFVFMSFF